MPILHAETLQRFAADLLAAGGASPEEAARTAQGLISANLCGYDSHGVMRIPYYVGANAAGEVVSGAEWEVLHEGPSLLAVDAHWGFGHVAAQRLAERLMQKAQTTGVAVGTMKQSAHIGRLGEYAEIAAQQDLVLMCMVNSHGAAHRVAPPGGSRSRLATNPICIGVPNLETPLVLDFSTSATAEGKVRVKWIAGETMPEGMLIDAEGRPTNDPGVLYGDPHGAILPFGGPQAYKAFGLSMMIDVLTGALSGGLCSREKKETPLGNCVFMLVLDPQYFGGREHFAREVAGIAAWVKSCPSADGQPPVMLPGDPERNVASQRVADGISLDEENWAKLTQLAGQLGVGLP